MQRTADQTKQLKKLAFFWQEADDAVLNLSKTRFPKAPPLPFPRTGIASLGLFDRLPLEVMQMTLEYLDLASLASVRYVNIRGRAVVDSIASYRMLATFCHSTLRGLAATGILGKHSMKDIHNAACLDRCEFCGGFGSFLYMPTCRRVCIYCLTFHNWDLDLIPTSEAKSALRLTDYDLLQLNVMSTVPGSYGSAWALHQERQSRIRFLVQYKEASTLSRLRHRCKGRPEAEQIFTSKICGAFTEMRLYPFMASTPFPYLNIQQRRVENGLWCHGCQYNWNVKNISVQSLQNAKKGYSEEEFLVHLESCTHATFLWERYTKKGLPISYGGMPRVA